MIYFGEILNHLSLHRTRSSENYFFVFFNDQGQMSGVTYTFVPGEVTPEPRTLPLLTAMACAAFIAFKLRRGSPAC